MRVGAKLRRARERAGLSAEQIADRTKIQLHRIEALENDHFESLPAGIYLDGIVRAYAHEVGIVPESLIERVRDARAEVAKNWQAGPADLDAFASERQVTNEAAAAPPKPDVVGAVEPARRERGPGRFVLPLLLLLAAAGLGGYFYLPRGEFNRDGIRDTHATTADASATATPTTPVAPSGRSAAATVHGPQINTGTAVRETEVVTGTSGPKERAIPGAAATATAPVAPTTVGRAAAPVKDVSGAWTLATHVESSSYQRFEGLQLGYDIQLEQAGNRVTGTGRKVSENGDGISSRVQTPISVAGTINGDRLTLIFNERGARRPTKGKFVLLLDEGGTILQQCRAVLRHRRGPPPATITTLPMRVPRGPSSAPSSTKAGRQSSYLRISRAPRVPGSRRRPGDAP